MNFLMKKIIFLSLIFFVASCAEYKTDKIKQKIDKKFYASSGFALIYDENLYKQGLINKKFRKVENMVLHSYLKRNTPVIISNPINSKSVITKIYSTAIYPSFFNVVISKEIAEIIELDLENPFIELIETKKNKTFIAKKGTMYDEEKNVAAKAPVEKIEIDNLDTRKKTKKKSIKKHSFLLIIADFFYLESADNLKKELYDKTKLNNLSIKKINDDKYRLYVGPFKNFNSLKLTYISLNKLGFDDLNIIKNND